MNNAAAASNDNSIALTILDHFGGRAALSLIGGQALTDARALTVIFKGKATNKADRVKIVLNAADLYEVTFYKFNRRTLTCLAVGQTVEVFSADLKNYFERETGLLVSFQARRAPFAYCIAFASCVVLSFGV